MREAQKNGKPLEPLQGPFLYIFFDFPVFSRRTFSGDLDQSWREFAPKLLALDEAGSASPEKQPFAAAYSHALEKTNGSSKPQVGLPNEDDIKNWSHHASVATVDDEVLRRCVASAPHLVSFVFGLAINADLVRQRMAQN